MEARQPFIPPALIPADTVDYCPIPLLALPRHRSLRALGLGHKATLLANGHLRNGKASALVQDHALRLQHTQAAWTDKVQLHLDGGVELVLFQQ